jgi:glycerol-3-phosphate O-acyltransferase
MEKFSKNFKEELSYCLVDNLVVMTTSLVATVILMNRRGISLDLLEKRVAFVYDEISARKGIISTTLPTTPKMIASCLSYLKDFVDNKKQIYEPLISPKTGEKTILMLAYYRNNLTHILINEAEIACSLLGFSLDNDINQGLSIESVLKKTLFLK